MGGHAQVGRLLFISGVSAFVARDKDRRGQGLPPPPPNPHLLHLYRKGQRPTWSKRGCYRTQRGATGRNRAPQHALQHANRAPTACKQGATGSCSMQRRARQGAAKVRNRVQQNATERAVRKQWRCRLQQGAQQGATECNGARSGATGALRAASRARRSRVAAATRAGLGNRGPVSNPQLLLFRV